MLSVPIKNSILFFSFKKEESQFIGFLLYENLTLMINTVTAEADPSVS